MTSLEGCGAQRTELPLPRSVCRWHCPWVTVSPP